MSVAAAILTGLVLIASPEKGYVHPGDPIQVRFAQSQQANAPQLVEALGIRDALKVPDTFKPANADAIVDQAGEPNFQIYTWEGKQLEPKAVGKVDLSKGVLDIAAAYPQIRETGTYILTWQSAQPLVIQTQRSAIPWGAIKNEAFPPQQRQMLLQQMKKGDPVITRIVPLEYAVISTDKGDITATFDYSIAPRTISNFVDLAKQGYYDDSAFHRIIKGFMIQGGDSLAHTEDRAGTGGPGFNQTAEFSDKQHDRGTLSMARTGLDPNTAGGQFFIVHGKAPHLDNEYTAFGQVVEGMDIVDKLAETPVTDRNGSVKKENRPALKTITIKPATPARYGIKAPGGTPATAPATAPAK